MSKWRFIPWTGIILGIVLEGIDHFLLEIPHAVYIPLQLVAIGMIFAGFFCRKREKTQNEGQKK